MANTSFKVENGLLVQGNAQFDYTSKFNANVTVAADQFYIGGNLYVTGAQVFIGGNAAVADILAGASGLSIGNTTHQFSAHLSNVFVYGTHLNPVGNTVQLGNSTNRWVISGNTLNISTTSTLTGAATLANTIAVTGAATLANTLGVIGATTLSNTMSVTGAANALSTFGIGGAANALSTFGVTGAANALSTLGISGAANALSTFGVTGVATFANTTSHIGAATFSNTLAVTGTTTLTGNATLSGTLQTISGNAAFNSSTLFVDATNNRVGIGTTGPATTLTIQGTLNANGAATLSNTSAHTGSATFANTIAVTGAATLANTLAVTGTTTFNNDVTINANLTVTGTRTYVNTQTLDISDNIITLNADLPGASPPTENAGLEINRGSSANSRLQWNETTDTWQITADGTNFFNILSEGTSNTSFDSGTLFVDAVNNRVGINNTAPGVALRVTGAVDISSTANIQSNANVGGTLGVASLLTASALNVTNQTNTATLFVTTSANVGTALTINATALTVAPNTNIGSGKLFVDTVNGRVGINNTAPGVALRVTGAADISSTANIQSNANVGGTLGVASLLTASGGLAVTGIANVSSNLNVTGAANALSTFGVNGLLTAAAGLTVTGTSNVSAQFNVGGGVATTNGATITNTSILLGNSSVNTMISPSQILIRTNATGNAYSQLSLASSDQVGGSLALQHGNTTSNSTVVLGAQSGNNASIELGGSSAAFIDFKTPSEDDFDTRLISTTSGFTIAAGSSTSANIVNITSANVNIDAGTLFVDAVNNRVGINNTAPGVALRVTGAVDISSTANIQSNANVGGTLGVTGAANALSTFGVNGLLTACSGLIVTGTANVSTNLNVTGTANVSNNLQVIGQIQLGTYGTTNGVLISNTGLSMGNVTHFTTQTRSQFVITAGTGVRANLTSTALFVGNTTSNAIVSGNLISISNTANLTSTTLTIGATTVNNSQVNSALHTAGLFGVTNGSTINATFMVIGNTTSNAIVSGNLISVSNTANLTSTTLTIGTTTVTTALINTAAINVVNRTNTATLFVTTSANVGTALTINSTALAVTPNANFDSGVLFVDAVNNRVGINNTAPGVALRITGAADVSEAMTVGTNMGISGTLGVSGVATLSANLVVDATTLFVDAVNNRVGIRDGSPVNALTINGITDTTGSIYIAKTAADAGVTAGIELQSAGTGYFTRSAGTTAIFNRLTDDGTIVAFQQAGTTEGTISIAGTTTTYGAFCGAHWSQLSDNSRPNILKGTVVETINEMCQWENEANDQLPKFKISDTAASKSVYGVFQTWDNDDDVNNDANIASLGAYVIRVDADVTVSKGDLLESAGNGCARVQSDDIIRSSTIGKVTNGSHVIETYEDGSYLIPCVLYCG